jgi:hypothetical protein
MDGGSTVATPFNMSVITMSTDDTTPYIGVFDAIGARQGASLVGWNDTDIISKRCQLSFCMQSYSVSTSNGDQSQAVTQTWSTAQYNSADKYVRINFTDIPSEMNVSSGDVYSIMGQAAVAIQDEVQPMFEGDAILMSSMNTYKYSVNYIQTIWEGLEDINSVFEDVAGQMTTVLRQTGNVTTSTDYSGTVYTTATVIQVRWAWLTGPVAIVLLSVVYLLAGILQTRSSGVGAWKSSPLAMLFMTPELPLRAAIRDDMTTSAELEKMVGGRRVALELRSQGEWVFRPA